MITRIIKLPNETNEQLINQLTTSLSEIDAIENYAFKDNKLTVTYNFPEMSFRGIWDQILSVINSDQFTATDRFKNLLIAFIEGNKQDYLSKSVAWEYYVRNIYVTHSISEKRNKESVLHPPGWQEKEVD